MSNVPKLRFKEFSEEWAEKKLLSLSENGFSNGAFNDPKKVGSGYKIINVKDMYIDGTINTNSLTKVALDEKEFLKNRVEYGDIFFTISSETPDEIGMSSVLLEDVKNVYLNSFCFGFRLNSFNPNSAIEKKEYFSILISNCVAVEKNKR